MFKGDAPPPPAQEAAGSMQQATVQAGGRAAAPCTHLHPPPSHGRRPCWALQRARRVPAALLVLVLLSQGATMGRTGARHCRVLGDSPEQLNHVIGLQVTAVLMARKRGHACFMPGPWRGVLHSCNPGM